MSGDEELQRVFIRSKDGSRKHEVSMRRIAADSHLVGPTLKLMVDYFLPRESMNTILDLQSDAESVQSLIDAWKEKFTEGNCITCVLIEDPMPAQPTVIAANMTYVVHKDDQDYDSVRGGKAYSTIMEILKETTEAVDICKKYKVDSYLGAMGLTVHPEYHGMSLGEEIVKSREPLCRKLGVKCSATLFTSPVSQGLAAKAGFETIYSKLYNNFIVGGEQVLAAAEPTKEMKIMARTYDF